MNKFSSPLSFRNFYGAKRNKNIRNPGEKAMCYLNLPGFMTYTAIPPGSLSLAPLARDDKKKNVSFY